MTTRLALPCALALAIALCPKSGAVSPSSEIAGLSLATRCEFEYTLKATRRNLLLGRSPAEGPDEGAYGEASIRGHWVVSDTPGTTPSEGLTRELLAHTRSVRLSHGYSTLSIADAGADWPQEKPTQINGARVHFGLIDGAPLVEVEEPWKSDKSFLQSAFCDPTMRFADLDGAIRKAIMVAPRVLPLPKLLDVFDHINLDWENMVGRAIGYVPSPLAALDSGNSVRVAFEVAPRPDGAASSIVCCLIPGNRSIPIRINTEESDILIDTLVGQVPGARAITIEGRADVSGRLEYDTTSNRIVAMQLRVTSTFTVRTREAANDKVIVDLRQDCESTFSVNIIRE